MKSKKQIRALIARAEELEAKSGGKVAFPAWMKDEKEVVKNRKMTPEEMQEFNTMMCEFLRSSVALVYLAECKSRWGEKHNAPVFINADISLGLTSKVVEQALITHIEPLLMENPKYPGNEGVVYFYMGHELNSQKDKRHLTEIIDDVFNTMCEEIRANNYQMLSAATVH